MDTQEQQTKARKQSVILKLSNGREVMGYVVEMVYGVVILTDVYEIMYMPTESMIPNIMFMKYMVFNGENEIGFQMNHVVNIVFPRPVVSNYYDFVVEKYGTNIEDQIDKQLTMMMFKKGASDEEKKEVYSALLESLNYEGVLQ